MCKLILMHILCSALFYTVSSSYEEQPMYTEATIKINNKKLSNQGKFGKKSPKEKRSGYLYYHNKQKWCSSFGPITTDNSDKWIALIPVGNCTYREKIKVANFYNMSAVIFINNDDTVPKYRGDSSITVSIIVNKETGEELINHVLKRDTYCSIDTGKSIIDRRWKVSRTSVLFVLVSFILLMCISLAWLVFYYVQRFRHIYQNDRKEKQLLSAAKKAISKLKAIPYDSATHEEDETCAVCLEAYKECESLRELPCKHQFHKSCIDPWLLYHRTCPMCKSNILKSLGVNMPPPAPSTIFSPNLNVSDTDSDRSTMALVTSNVPSAV